ncbi:MAG: alpha/beta fold hydrolase [Bryobacteraceae bacterium]
MLHALLLFWLAAPFTPQHAAQLRAKILAALFVPQPLPGIDAKSYGTFEPMAGVVAERITYATEYNLRAPAILYMPKNKPRGKMPALIVVNGHGGDKYSWYSFYSGMLYAQAGAAVLTYDAIGEGERNIQHKSGTRAHDHYVAPDEMGQRMGGLMMTDLRQAVSYLSSRPEVDPRRIAAMGYSMGSFVVALTCAVETRLHACVEVGGGDLDGEGGMWESRGKSMCQGIPYFTLRFLGDRPAVLYALQAEHGHTLIYNGSADTVVKIPEHYLDFFADMRKRTLALLGSSPAAKNIFDYDFYPNTSHRPYFVTKPVALWLNRQLHFPNWTDAQIEAMPVTHIIDWAKANDVAMDRGYISEEREGGTPALGTGIPGVPREELNVLPRDEWEKVKDTMILESWLADAKKQVTDGSRK